MVYFLRNRYDFGIEGHCDESRLPVLLGTAASLADQRRACYLPGDWRGHRDELPLHFYWEAVVLAQMEGDEAAEREIRSRFAHLDDGLGRLRPAPELMAFISRRGRPYDGEENQALGLPPVKRKASAAVAPVPVSAGLGGRLRRRG